MLLLHEKRTIKLVSPLKIILSENFVCEHYRNIY